MTPPPSSAVVVPSSPRFVRLSFYALAFLFAIPYGALNSVNQTAQAVFGGAPGASPAAIALADDLARTANVVISASWLAFLFLVPALLEWARGARNAFAAMMFAWTGAGAMLVGAFALSLREGGGADQPISAATTAGMRACAVLFGLLVGLFGGLGYTATEVFLDSCAEWMPLALDEEKEEEKERGGVVEGGGAPAASTAAAAAATAKEADAAKAAALSSFPSSFSTFAPATDAAELAAATALRHKFVASRYKNIFASHIYAFVEVGTVAFTLPGALGLVDGPKMLRLLIAITCCLLAGAVASLFVPDLQDPSKKGGEEENEEGKNRFSCLSALAAAVAGAARSAVQSVTCLRAYDGLAALAIVPYFLSAAYADNYFQFVVLGTQCGLRSKAEGGIALEGVTVMALFGSAVQAAAAFAGPALVGPRKLQFREHVAPLALGNLCGAAGALLVVGLGGIAPRLCGSMPLMLVAKALSSVAFGVNNSVGVAAVLCWYSGKYQHLVVSALASRSVWTQLGGIVGPYTFGDAFATMKGGKPAALLAAAIYASGSLCVVAAHMINEATQRRRAARRMKDAALAAGEEGAVLSEAELRLAEQEGKMTAGFSDSPSAAAWRESVVAVSSPSLRRRTRRSEQPREV